MTSIARRSHGPVRGTPYSQILMNIMAILNWACQAVTWCQVPEEDSRDKLWIELEDVPPGSHGRGILTKEGMNRDSTWSVKELIKVPGRTWNLIEMHMQFTMKRIRLKREKMIPTMSSQVDRYGT